MNKAQPFVSIIVPSFNHRHYVGTLIESIYSQSYKNFEVIILDDGSKDGSPDYLKELSQKYNFQLILKENEGLCKTLNRGLEIAKGAYIVMIASDDILMPKRLEEQVEYLEQNPQVDVVGGCMKVIDPHGIECGEKIPGIFGSITFKQMVQINRLFAPSVMVRANVFSKFGYYPEDSILEDYYLWLKILHAGGTIHNVKKFWVYYRIFNVDLEKKFLWYYKGAHQALLPYKDISLVANQLHRIKFYFLIKVTLLLGRNALKKYGEYLQSINIIFRSAVLLTAMLSVRTRGQILKKLNLKT